MKTRKVIVVTVLLFGLALVSVPAWGMGTCMDCHYTIGLYICIPNQMELSGWKHCIAWTDCFDGECIEFCAKWDPCLWA